MSTGDDPSKGKEKKTETVMDDRVLSQLSKLTSEKLTMTNWMVWSRIVMTRLKGLCRHGHLTKDPPKPITEIWEAEDSLILAAMWDAMDRKVRDTVMQCSTARKCWERLEMTYSGLSSQTHAYDVMQAYNRPSMGSQTHDDYWVSFQKSVEEREELFPITDLGTVRKHRQQQHVMNYLSGLPVEFSQARPAVMAHPIARENVVEAYKLLREMYPSALGDKAPPTPTEGASAESSALAATQPRRGGGGRGNGRGGGRSGGGGRGGGRNDVWCHYCHEKGHMKYECPQSRNPPQRPSQWRSAQVASTSNTLSETLDEEEIKWIQEHRAQQSSSPSANIAKSGPCDEEDDWHRTYF